MATKMSAEGSFARERHFCDVDHASFLELRSCVRDRVQVDPSSSVSHHPALQTPGSISPRQLFSFT